MKKFSSLFLITLAGLLALHGQISNKVKPVKNVIVMIPDGTSTGVVSAARWYKMYNNSGRNLNLDPHLCGTVSTYCSNSPIGDSAPTMSCYMTGVPSQAGNIGIYPVVDADNDLVQLDPEMAYQPLVTLMEAARIKQGKSTGIVVTCEFSHATPANCAAHHYNRAAYKDIAPQMAYNNLDVLFGGGTSLVSDDMKAHFKRNSTALILDDIAAFRNFKSNGKVWALFEKMDLPYDIDRDPSKTPSLEEMTRKAIELLSKNKNGFFLMVEGSKVDWAAHANDAAGCITEFIAFDNAVGAVMAFARKNGETAVVIMPDHGNSGFSIGRAGFKGSFIKDLFGTVSKYKKTAEGMADIINTTQPDKVSDIFIQNTGIELKDEELKKITSSNDYRMRSNDVPGNNISLKNNIIGIMNSRTCFGFTTGGHTGEEVFFAAYHPAGYRPTGFVTNIQINEYLCKAIGLTIPLPELSRKLFAKHTEALSGLDYAVDTTGEFPALTVKKGNSTLVIRAFCSVAFLNGKPIDIGSVTVYIDKNNTFYLPDDIRNMLL